MIFCVFFAKVFSRQETIPIRTPLQNNDSLGNEDAGIANGICARLKKKLEELHYFASNIHMDQPV